MKDLDHQGGIDHLSEERKYRMPLDKKKSFDEILDLAVEAPSNKQNKQTSSYKFPGREVSPQGVVTIFCLQIQLEQ